MTTPEHFFARDLDGIYSVEVVADGDNVPVIIWNVGQRRFRADFTLTEVTTDPFYAKNRVFDNLAKKRAADGTKEE